MRGAGWSRVTHPFATLCAPEGALTVRLACVRHAASVHPEPGSNSPLKLSRGGIPRAGSLGSVSWSLSRKSLALASDPSCLCPQRTASPPSGGSARGSKNLTCAPAGLPPGRLDLCCTRYPVLKVPSLGEVAPSFGAKRYTTPLRPPGQGGIGDFPRNRPEKGPLPPDPTPRLHNPRPFVETQRTQTVL